MNHKRYVAKAKEVLAIRENAARYTFNTEVRIRVLHLDTGWSYTQCKNLVDEIEGRFVYVAPRRNSLY